MIISNCPHCGEQSGADESAEGLEMNCGVCGKSFTFHSNPIPSQETTQSAKGSSVASWGCLIAALLLFVGSGIFAFRLLNESEPDAIAERKAENRKLQEERLKPALSLRTEILDGKWNHLFEKEKGTPSKITIDEKLDVQAALDGIQIDGIAIIDGTKYDFNFYRKKAGDSVSDQFHLSEWEEYKPPAKTDEIAAWVAFQQAVEIRLKSPKSAKFPSGGHRSVKHLGSGKYSVDSYVDAQNNFGANVRMNFSGTIQSTPEGWKVISLSLNEP